MTTIPRDLAPLLRKPLAAWLLRRALSLPNNVPAHLLELADAADDALITEPDDEAFAVLASVCRALAPVMAVANRPVASKPTDAPDLMPVPPLPRGGPMRLVGDLRRAATTTGHLMPETREWMGAYATIIEEQMREAMRHG